MEKIELPVFDKITEQSVVIYHNTNGVIKPRLSVIKSIYKLPDILHSRGYYADKVLDMVFDDETFSEMDDSILQTIVIHYGAQDRIEIDVYCAFNISIIKDLYNKEADQQIMCGVKQNKELSNTKVIVIGYYDGKTYTETPVEIEANYLLPDKLVAYNEGPNNDKNTMSTHSVGIHQSILYIENQNNYKVVKLTSKVTLPTIMYDAQSLDLPVDIMNTGITHNNGTMSNKSKDTTTKEYLKEEIPCEEPSLEEKYKRINIYLYDGSVVTIVGHLDTTDKDVLSVNNDNGRAYSITRSLVKGYSISVPKEYTT